MSSEISYRHNVMTVSSVEAFLNLRGGFWKNVRQVFFVRALGELPDADGFLSDIDRRMKEEEKRVFLGETSASLVRKAGDAVQKKGCYCRLTELPKLEKMGDIAFYSDAYEVWKSGGKITIKSQPQDERFWQVLGAALKEVLRLYETWVTHRGSFYEMMNPETVSKNYMAKLCFWTDRVLPGLIACWSERISVKIIAGHVLSAQEYLFYYMATLLGCDVLIFNNSKEDIKAGDELLKLSGAFDISDSAAACGKGVGGKELGGMSTSAQGSGKGAVGKGPAGAPASAWESAQNSGGKETGGMSTASWESGKGAGGKGPAGAPASARESAQNGGGKETAGASTAFRESGKGAGGKGPAGAPASVRESARNSVGKPAGAPTSSPVPPQEFAEREKSCEELAGKAAPSIVLITVCDKSGKPVSSGSGIMIARHGFILTNYHVVRSGSLFMVRMEEDGKIYATDEVIKYHPQLDLAVIRVNRELEPLPVFDGRKKLLRGQKVVAIGSPLGLFNTVSEGIISGFRTVNGVNMIQFTAPISPGSSGGALLNMYGEVIGISTAGIDDGQNINLAVDYVSIRSFAREFLRG